MASLAESTDAPGKVNEKLQDIQIKRSGNISFNVV